MPALRQSTHWLRLKTASFREFAAGHPTVSAALGALVILGAWCGFPLFVDPLPFLLFAAAVNSSVYLAGRIGFEDTLSPWRNPVRAVGALGVAVVVAFLSLERGISFRSPLLPGGILFLTTLLLLSLALGTWVKLLLTALQRSGRGMLLLGALPAVTALAWGLHALDPGYARRLIQAYGYGAGLWLLASGAWKKDLLRFCGGAVLIVPLIFLGNFGGWEQLFIVIGAAGLALALGVARAIYLFHARRKVPLYRVVAVLLAVAAGVAAILYREKSPAETSLPLVAFLTIASLLAWVLYAALWKRKLPLFWAGALCIAAWGLVRLAKSAGLEALLLLEVPLFLSFAAVLAVMLYVALKEKRPALLLGALAEIAALSLVLYLGGVTPWEFRSLFREALVGAVFVLIPLILYVSVGWAKKLFSKRA